MHTTSLNNGSTIPTVGFGVFMMNDSTLCQSSIETALSQGYRHIDTAQIYGNEAAVGHALMASSLPRKDLYITTKLWPSNYSAKKIDAAIDRSLMRLQTDYIDLMLLHRPYEDYIGAWHTLEKAVHSGKIRTIGLSNFDMPQIKVILHEGTITPAVNQVECHPYEQQQALRQFMSNHDIKLEAWYPLGHGYKPLLSEPLFQKLSTRYNKSVIQIILRWHVQMGNIIFPKSTNPAHIASNISIFDFELTSEDMMAIQSLDRQQSLFKQPDWLMKLTTKFNKLQNI